MSFDLRLTLLSGGELTAAAQTREILACNDDTAAYGLQLTPQQARALLETWAAPSCGG